MKTTTQLPALLFAAFVVTAIAADTPAPALTSSAVNVSNPPEEPTPLEPAPPILAFPPEPPKAEPIAATPSAASLPAVSQSNLSNGTAPAVPLSPFVNPPPEEKPEDPELLKLPKMVVKQKPRPRLTPEIMVTKKAFGEDLVRQKNTQLDQVLNKFTLPLFGVSAAERALDEHEREKRAQLNLDVLNLVKVLETTDPDEAKSLKEAARP